MAATIQCRDSEKSEIRSYLLQALGALMESIRETADAVSVEDCEGGWGISYPVGEIYGYTSDYVQSIPGIFAALKEMYPDIAVRGTAYEYETVSETAFGPFFRCAKEEPALTVTYEWQECANCGEIVEADTVYNSSQRNLEEGNLFCLCCPTCMLEYALSGKSSELQPNGSFSDEELEKIYSSEDEEKALKKLLWKRITLNREEYADDFEAKRERITALLQQKGVTAARKKVLTAILENRHAAKESVPSAEDAAEIDFAKSIFVLSGFDYAQENRIRSDLARRNAAVKERVSSKVQYVIVPDGKFSKDGNYRKAEELAARGSGISLLPFARYRQLLRKYDESLFGSEGAALLDLFSVTVSEGQACLERYIGDAACVSIPEAIGPYPISRLGKRCFQHSKIRSVNIPDTITELPAEVFAFCDELTQPVLPAHLACIGDGAFESCGNLSEITLPEGLHQIGKNAFHDCKSLRQILLPDTLGILEENAFGGCTELREVYIPAGLQFMRFPFAGCDRLRRIEVDPGNAVYDSRNACSAVIETGSDKVVMGCPGTVLPDSVRIIGEGAFSGFESLTEFVVPEGIVEIEDFAFAYCFSLRSLSLPASVEKIGEYAFCYCRSLPRLELPENLETFPVSALANCEQLAELVVHDKLTGIEGLENAWMHNLRLRRVYGSKNSIAKDIAEKRRCEYTEL